MNYYFITSLDAKKYGVSMSPENMVVTIDEVNVEIDDKIITYEVKYDNEDKPYILRSEMIWETIDELFEHYTHRTYSGILEATLDNLDEALSYLDSSRWMEWEKDVEEIGIHLFRKKLKELPKIFDEDPDLDIEEC